MAGQKRRSDTMGLRLTLLDLWTPNWVINRELARMDAKTTAALKELIKNNTSLYVEAPEPPLVGNLQDRRNAMAKRHKELVEMLAGAIGKDQAVLLGRDALFKVGQELGAETRRRLGVKNAKDLVKAANIMYRVLGIEFHANWVSKDHAVITVNRCALAAVYSELTCEVLSAADEGVVNGLLPTVTMHFEEMLTGGCNACHAEINVEETPR
jgi:predicted ArsR family transcriptional regulator